MSYPVYNEALKDKLDNELRVVGKSLKKLPSSTDELFTLLEKAEKVLHKVWQQRPETTGKALTSSMKALVNEKLLRHTDLNIQLVLASCMMEITRITAPDAPYNDDQMKEVFQLFMIAMKQISLGPSVHYVRGMRVLEAMAKLRFCVIMLDTEWDSMSAEMFQIFFDVIQSHHTAHILNYMETVMTIVIAESDCDNLSAELLRPILENTKMANKDISPISWELGKTVVEKCTTRLRNHLKDAMKSLNLNVHDYPEIIYSLCKEATSEENTVVEEVTANVPSTTVGPSGDDAAQVGGSSKSEEVKSTGDVNDANQNNLDDGAVETLKRCEQIVQLKDNNAKPDSANIEETGQHTNTDNGVILGKRGRKPNTWRGPEEGYAHIWAMEDSGSYRRPRNKIKREKGVSPLPSEHGEEKIPTDSSCKEVDLVSEVSILKRNQSNNKEIIVKNGDQEISSRRRRKAMKSKGKERGPITSKKGTKGVGSGSSAGSIEKGEGNHNATNVEGNVEVLLQEPSKGTEIKDEDTSQKCEGWDDADKIAESPVSMPANEKNSEKLTPEKEKKFREPVTDYGEELVDSRIMVWWPMDKTFYTGTVFTYDPSTKMHQIVYDDDEQEVLNLENEIWEVFNEEQPQQVHSSQRGEADRKSPSVKDRKRTNKRKLAGSSKSNTALSSKRSKSDELSIDLGNDDSDDETSESYFS